MAMHAKWITAPGLSERAPVVLHFQRVLDLDPEELHHDDVLGAPAGNASL